MVGLLPQRRGYRLACAGFVAGQGLRTGQIVEQLDTGTGLTGGSGQAFGRFAKAARRAEGESLAIGNVVGNLTAG